MSKENIDIVVYVLGGMVQEIRSSRKGVSVEVFDVDNKKAEGKSGDEIDKEWNKMVDKHYPNVINY